MVYLKEISVAMERLLPERGAAVELVRRELPVTLRVELTAVPAVPDRLIPLPAYL
jgi:hypothetical protein